MAPRQRRRTPRSAAALGLLVAFVAGFYVGQRARGESDAEAAAPAKEAPTLTVAGPDGAVVARGPAVGTGLDEVPGSARADDPRRGALDDRFRAVIGRWARDAVTRSKAVRSEADVRVAAYVRELDTGSELVRLEADRPMRSASNMKLVTTAAALVLFGPDMAFETGFEAGGPIRGGELQGDLIVRAGGDPLATPAAIEAFGDALARVLADHGIRAIAGDVVLDEGDYAEPEPAPGWPDASQSWADYCALSGGFTAGGGVVVATVRPRGAGRQARVDLHPAHHGLPERIDVEGTSGSKLDVRVGATRSALTVRGVLPASRDEYVASFSHPDPVALFGAVLLGELQRAGVRLRGDVVRRRGEPRGELLSVLRSPVTDVLQSINADSHNGVSDQLFLTLGHRLLGDGSRAGGRRATATALERLGVPSDGLVQADGSGLSRDNRVSARQLGSLLAAVLALDGPSARLYRDSLAVGGRSGTLEDRFVGTPSAGRVHAKTGWIRGTSALGGLAEALDGRQLVFSILVEYPPEAGGLNTSCFKPMQDELVRILVEESP